MFKMLFWLYDGGKGKLTTGLLANAVNIGWIGRYRRMYPE